MFGRLPEANELYARPGGPGVSLELIRLPAPGGFTVVVRGNWTV